jgi:Domain of unknown function (DUF4134)
MKMCRLKSEGLSFTSKKDKVNNGNCFHRNRAKVWALAITAWLILIKTKVQAQTADGNAGINQANTTVRSYFDAGTNLMYAVGAILGLIGAVKVYQKWNHGDHDTGKVAAAWFGSCIFLVIVATVLKSFFGL